MGKVTDLRGRVFGRLSIPATAEPQIRDGHAYWPCRCECGAQLWVRGSKLQAGLVVSCGCQRADPEIRRAARWQVPERKRRAIARAGAKARWSAEEQEKLIR